jgi:hypothetical protein
MLFRRNAEAATVNCKRPRQDKETCQDEKLYLRRMTTHKGHGTVVEIIFSS